MTGILHQTSWITITIVFVLPFSEPRLSKDDIYKPESYSINTDDSSQVLGIDTGYSSILIGTSEHIYVYNLSSEALNDEFCVISDNSFCTLIKNKIIGLEIGSVSIEYNDNTLFVQIIHTSNRAATLLYKTDGVTNMTSLLDTEQYTFDDPGLLHRISVGAFAREEYFYHVASSFQAYDPYADNDPLLNRHSRKELVVKMSRLCARDSNNAIASLIDIKLDCRADTSVPITSLSRLHYDSTRDFLWFTIHTANGANHMCKFYMQNVNKHFDDIWNICKMAYSLKSEYECQNTTDNSNYDHCFAFARNSSSGSMRQCSSLNITTDVENCSIGDDQKYGWLEYIKPFWQEPVFSAMSDNEIVTQTLPLPESNNIIYTSYGLNNTFNYLYWKDPIEQSKADFHFLQTSTNLGSSRNIAIFQKYLCFVNGTSVRIVPISCDSFYKTCESLVKGKWMSTPGCKWCPSDGNFTDSYEDETTCKQAITECPVVTEHAQSQATFAPVGEIVSKVPDSTTSKIQSSSEFSEKGTDWLITSLLGGALLMLVVLVGFIIKEQAKVVRQYGYNDVRPKQLWLNARPLLTGDTNDDSAVPETIISTFTLSSTQAKYDYANRFKNIDDGIKIDISALQLVETIGEGNFGVVHRGTYTTPDGDIMNVACKKLRDGEPGVRAFFEEGLTMMNFHHARVLPFIGIALANDKDPIIVTKFMPNGNLLCFLQNNANTISLEQIIDYAMQIAEGMEYLHSKKFIHRDLAARNCMLDYKMQLKIGDFGLARQCNDQNMYLSCNYPDMPFAWASIEALEFWTFTFNCDIWSYGVVVWELMSKGEKPFPKYTPSGLLKFLKDGNRLYRPPNCPKEIYNSIMMPCWDADMNKRPNFSALLELLKKFPGFEYSER